MIGAIDEAKNKADKNTEKNKSDPAKKEIKGSNKNKSGSSIKGNKKSKKTGQILQIRRKTGRK